MIRKTFEVITGLAIGICLFTNYYGGIHPGELLIWHLLTPSILKAVAWIVLFFLSGLLIYGKYRDYSGWVVRAMGNLFERKYRS